MTHVQTVTEQHYPLIVYKRNMQDNIHLRMGCFVNETEEEK